ncbi:MAG: helix-turn-helix transcriptional regulator [Agathobacter sp.]|nr:helix-turn-helix transcriptional regulator [Agathobacter sp.]
MYVNERDQINYHGFLRALREMNHVSQECVSKGVCTVSGMNRFENGNRVAEKLMRDRLTARLGISGETYEEYLQPKEYVLWEHRLRIVNAIEKRNLKLARKELEAYETYNDLNRINIQFIEAMRFMLLELEGTSEEELLECINKAVKCTVSSVKKALDGAHLLADQEINLIAEQMRLSMPKKMVRDINTWHIKEYEKLVTYIEHSYWEDLQKAKVYPKLAYYISKCILEKEATIEELKRGLELCNIAIELLRDVSRLYYFIELTEARNALGARLMEFSLEQEEFKQIQSMLEENNAWENLFKGLYEEYGVRTYMSNFCYLYYETECHDMVEVIEARRSMLGLSRVKLAEGICTDRTIIRIEREGRSPSIELVRRLFSKLGMCAEYRRAPIITIDKNSLTVDYINLIKAANDNDVENALEYIHRLKENISMQLPFNKQSIMRYENINLYNKGEIDKDEYINSVRVALESTVSLSDLRGNSLRYFTVEEMECIYVLAFEPESELADLCLRIVGETCQKEMECEIKVGRLAMLELLMERFSSKLGDEGKYEESNKMSDGLLKECLEHYRMKDLANPLYNKIWNYQHMGGCNKTYIALFLSRCTKVCQINKKYNAAAFFQNKLNKI